MLTSSKKEKNKTKQNHGTFLEVHWLRLCAPNAGGAGLIPSWVTKILHALAKKKKKNKKPFIETSRILFDQISEYCWLAKLTHKINHRQSVHFIP